MKLSEIVNPQHNEIKQWLDKMGIKNYTIRPDGIVDVDGPVILHNKSISSIPVQFGKVTSHFDCAHTNISSLEGAPSFVAGDFFCHKTKIESLQGIHKIVKQINGWFRCNKNATHVLGLLLIPGITYINIDDAGPIDKIMNKYIGTGDIISAQDELIDAGFKEQAKL